MKELPAGWASARLDEVATVSGGIQKQPSRAPVKNVAPFLRVANVGSGVLDLRDVHEIEIEPDELDRYQLQPGDLLVVEGNGSASQIGRAALWSGEIFPCVHQNHLIRVRPGAAIRPRFLEYLWMSPSVSEAVRSQAASTSGLYVLTTRKVSAAQLAVAPVAEQDRIVAAIEEAFSKLDAGEAGLRTVRQLLKRMRDAVLAAAVTGRLVPQDPTDSPASKLIADIGAEIVSGPPLPDGWVWAEIGSLLSSIEAGKSFATQGRPAGPDEVGVIKVSAMTWREFRANENKVVPAGVKIDPSWFVRAGDLLFSRANTSEYVGACVLVPQDHPNLILSDKSLRLVPHAGVSSAWLLHTLRSRPVRAQIEELATGTKESMRNISQVKLRGIRVGVSPPQEQERVVAEVERQLSFVAACGRAVDAGLARSTATRRSVLKAAFEGRLVPQDPTDEPASVLLERIRAERSAAPKAGRRSRRTA